MPQDHLKQLTQKIINREKWWDILSRFIDVLRINLFIIDTEGNIFLPPEEGRCGGKLLTDPSLGFDFTHQPSIPIIKHFSQGSGNFLEAKNRFELHTFAIPISTAPNTTIAYMVVGPVILNKRLSDTSYESLAKEYNVSSKDLLNELNEIRVVSHIMMGSILNLLSEIIRDNIELSLRSQSQEKEQTEDFNTANNVQIRKMAQEIYSTVLLDELLMTFLDIALKMTNTECGSIMIIDDQNKDLTIKVSRGIQEERINNTKLKVGEGIAGAAVLENKMYFLKGQTTHNNRIHNLLRRPEIKQSLIMPLSNKQRVIGVLNLHTKTQESKLEDNVDNLKYLSQLLSTAF